jgi:hypothetical protein
MWKRKMIRVSQLSFRLLPRARNVWFRLSPTELLSGKIKGKFDDVSVVSDSAIEQKNSYGFRPLTEDEKKEFENSLNDDGKKMFSGKLLTDVEIKQKRKKQSGRSATLIPTVDPHN